MLGFDNIRASYKDLLSVQKRTEIEGRLALVDVQIKDESLAAVSPGKSW